jgi:hypothetical protein
MEKADRAMAMDFIDYICDNYRINSEGTSWEYFRQYKQLYADVNGRYMDTNDSREIKKVCYPSSLLLPQKANGYSVHSLVP